MGAEHRNKNKNKNKKSLSRRSDAEIATMARTKAKLAFGSLRAENAKLPTLVRYALGSLVLCLLAFFVFSYALPRTERKKEENVVEDPQEVRVFDYEVVNEYPHDPDAFTQGLFYDGNDTFYESTGLYGKSSIRKVDLKTGKVLQQQVMDRKYFGEGLSLWGSRLLQVAWLTKEGFIYDKHTLKPVGKFEHPMRDGWGLTSGEEHIIGSDGSANIYFMDPSTFKVGDMSTEVRKVTVKDGGRMVRWLNELEYIKGEIWANVYQTECIARISPQDGRVTGWLLMHGLKSALLAKGVKGMDVLNGIAWDSERNRLFVTGKQWPKVYEIKIIDHTTSYKDLSAVRGACMY